MKTFALPLAIILAGLAVAAGGFLSGGRYSAFEVTGAPGMVMRLDRYTGEIDWCTPNGCDPMMPAGSLSKILSRPNSN